MNRENTAGVQTLETALDVALAILRHGGSTRMADRAFHDALRGGGGTTAAVAWRLDFVAAHSSDGLSILRPVGPIGVNLSRASEAAVLADSIAGGRTDMVTARREIERIVTFAPPYRAWMMIAAAACAAAAFARVSGGDLGAVFVAAIAASIGQLLRAQLRRLHLPAVPVTLACGFVSAWIAAIGLRLGVTESAIGALIGSIIYMVPGLSLINGFVDIVAEKFQIVGIERIVEAVFLFVVLAIAVASAVFMVLDQTGQPRAETHSIYFTSLWSGVTAAATAVLLTAPPGHLVSSFVCGAAGRFTRDQLIAWGWPGNGATVLASAVIVLVAVALLRRHTVSPVVLIGGVLPLSATVALLKSIVHLMRVASLEGEALAVTADALASAAGQVLVTSLAIAAGLAAGMAIVRLVRREKVWSGV